MTDNSLPSGSDNKIITVCAGCQSRTLNVRMRGCLSNRIHVDNWEIDLSVMSTWKLR